MESLLGEMDFSSLETIVTVRKGHNFRSDRWMTLKFTDAVFLGVDVESLLGEAELSSLEKSVPVWKGFNF